MNLDSRDVKKLNELWGNKAKELEYSSDASKKYWLDHPTIIECVNEAITGDKKVDVFQFIKNLFPKPFETALILGSGTGSLERNLILNGTIKKCVSYEISKDAIEVARKKAQESNIDHLIHYELQDINHVILSEKTYDAVFGWHSLHHIENLEHIFSQIKKSLKRNGVFIVNEYVGPSRFQFTDKQIELMNWVIDMLPTPYKINVTNEKIKQHTYRERPEVIIESDPTESVRSQDIPLLLDVYFRKTMKKDYGGTLLQFVLAEIVGNFDPNDLKDRTLLEFLYKIEQLLIKERIISSDFTFITLENYMSAK